jgi:uncharacterized protein YpiB (UPF0302 family)
MKKEELVEYIAGELGLEKPAAKPKKKKAASAVLTKGQIAAKITGLKTARDEARKKDDKKMVDQLRRRLHILKRRQKKAA